jgi:hypothetical protein
LEQLLKKYFAKPISDNERYLFLRHDGGVIFDSHDLQDSETLGVLIAGTWQASNELKNRLKLNETDENFRLSFDTSSDGIHVVKVSQKKKEFYLVCIYKNCVTSGLLKRKLNVIKNKLEDELFLDTSFEGEVFETNFLFQKITDEEINKLFSNVGI